MQTTPEYSAWGRGETFLARLIKEESTMAKIETKEQTAARDALAREFEAEILHEEWIRRRAAAARKGDEFREYLNDMKALINARQAKRPINQ